MPATSTNETIRSAADPKVLHPLERLRGTIRLFVSLDGLLFAGLFLTFWFWATIALDFGLFRVSAFDWVQDSPWALRLVALLLALGMLALIVALRIVFRLNKQFSYPALALVLERRFPKILGDRLITAVELADVKTAVRYGYSEDMIRQTIAEARDRVDQVPVKSVFRWQRLWSRLAVIACTFAVLALGTYVLFGLVGKTFSQGEFANKSADVLAITAERDLMLRDTPWPRQAHLEVIDFPGVELRVGKDAPPPRVKVRAYEWVIVDRGTRDGWRPLHWKDLTQSFLGMEPPGTLAVQEETDWSADQMARASLMGASVFPAEKPTVTRMVDLTALTVDEVFSEYGSNRESLVAVFEKLTALASQSSMSRTLRKLDAPAEVVLVYRGKPSPNDRNLNALGSTRGVVKLPREKPGEFAAEVTGLKESVTFVAAAADYRTAARDIILVPPPLLTSLVRHELQPAYLYHSAPIVPGAAGSPSTLDFTQLRGLRQKLPPKPLSLTGDKSVCSIPVGSEVVLAGVADKPLSAVAIQPRSGKLPGQIVGSTAPIPVKPVGDQFTFAFTGDDRITQSLEFELVLTDNDGVVSTRPVVIQALEDSAPLVEVAVDGLRKVGNAYYATPRARVPFVKESLVRDDTGLSKVEFQFTVTRVEAQVVLGLQAQAMAALWSAPPDSPGIGSVFLPMAAAYLTAQLGKGEQRQFATLPAPPFDRAYDNLPKNTFESLKKLLSESATTDVPAVVREIKFNLESDVFDMIEADAILEARGKRMRVTDPGEVQPRFRMELNIVATDVNFETGPKQGRNLEPIRIMVVSEADLLAEISKDEEQLIAKLDEALRKLRDSQGKLAQQTDRLISPNPIPEILISARVRAEDIVQEVAKARDLTQTVAGEYGRLKKEVETNRCNESVPKRYENAIIRPLEAVLALEFKAAEDSLAGFRDPLVDNRRPDDLAQAAAKNNLATLILRLAQIRAQLGEALSESKLRDDLRKIIENQKIVSTALTSLHRRITESLFAPKIKPAAPVTLAKGEKKSVRHTVDWNVFDKGEFKVRIELPNGSELQAPAELTVKDDRNDFDFELTAGTRAGEYTVRINPSVGDPVELKVTVK